MTHRPIFKFIVVIAAMALFFGTSYLFASHERTRVQNELFSLIETCESAISSLDSQSPDEIANTAQSIKETSTALANSVNKPWWPIASAIPRFGNKVETTRALALSLDDALNNIIPPLLTTVEQEQTAWFVKDGKLDIETFETYAYLLSEASPSLQRLATAMEKSAGQSSGDDALKLTNYGTALSAVAAVFDAEDSFEPFLRTIFGEGGSRAYLLVIQSASRMQSSGGTPCIVGVASFEDGALTLSNIEPAHAAFNSTLPLDAQQTPEEAALFDNTDANVFDVAENPHFPRAARSLALAYELENNTTIDGVISMTPAALQRILGIVGPIQTSDGTWVDETNAAGVLEHNVLLELDGETVSQTDFMKEIVLTSYERLSDNLSLSLLLQLAQVSKAAIDEGSLTINLINNFEHRQISGLNWSGAINTGSTRPSLGVYFNVDDGSAMGWYVKATTEMGDAVAAENGGKTYTCVTTLTNTATKERLQQDGTSITGNSNGETPMTLYFVAPASGRIADMNPSVSATIERSFYKNNQILCARDVTLAPGQTITFEYSITTAPWADNEMTLRTTQLPIPAVVEEKKDK